MHNTNFLPLIIIINCTCQIKSESQIYILGAQFREVLMMCAGEKAIVPSQTMTVNNALTAGKQ